jgi:hypothetical protein
MKKFLATSLLLGAALCRRSRAACRWSLPAPPGRAGDHGPPQSLGTQTDDETIEWKASARVNEKSGDDVAHQLHQLQPQGADHRRSPRAEQ